MRFTSAPNAERINARELSLPTIITTITQLPRQVPAANQRRAQRELLVEPHLYLLHLSILLRYLRRLLAAAIRRTARRSKPIAAARANPNRNPNRITTTIIMSP